MVKVSTTRRFHLYGQWTVTVSHGFFCLNSLEGYCALHYRSDVTVCIDVDDDTAITPARCETKATVHCGKLYAETWLMWNINLMSVLREIWWQRLGGRKLTFDDVASCLLIGFSRTSTSSFLQLPSGGLEKQDDKWARGGGSNNMISSQWEKGVWEIKTDGQQ